MQQQRNGKKKRRHEATLKYINDVGRSNEGQCHSMGVSNPAAPQAAIVTSAVVSKRARKQVSAYKTKFHLAPASADAHVGTVERHEPVMALLDDLQKAPRSHMPGGERPTVFSNMNGLSAQTAVRPVGVAVTRSDTKNKNSDNMNTVAMFGLCTIVNTGLEEIRAFDLVGMQAVPAFTEVNGIKVPYIREKGQPATKYRPQTVRVCEHDTWRLLENVKATVRDKLYGSKEPTEHLVAQIGKHGAAIDRVSKHYGAELAKLETDPALTMGHFSPHSLRKFLRIYGHVRHAQTIQALLLKSSAVNDQNVVNGEGNGGHGERIRVRQHYVHWVREHLIPTIQDNTNMARPGANQAFVPLRGVNDKGASAKSARAAQQAVAIAGDEVAAAMPHCGQVIIEANWLMHTYICELFKDLRSNVLGLALTSAPPGKQFDIIVGARP